MIQTSYQQIDEELFDKFKLIKLVISDVDGVLSDGKIYLTEQGDEIKSFNAKDGCGIVSLSSCEVDFAVITGRTSNLLLKRMNNLKVKYVYQGYSDKIVAYENLMKKLNLTDEEVLYIGDDIIDIPLMNRVGIGIAVSDAHPFVKRSADLVTVNIGGNGAVREITDIILQANKKLSWIGASI